MPDPLDVIRGEGEAPPFLDAADVCLTEGRRMLSLMRRLGVAAQDAEDIKHEVLEIIVDRGPSFERKAERWTLVHALCRKRASKYRRQARTSRDLVPDLALALVRHIPTPQDEFEASEKMRLFSLALSQLAPRQRRVLELLDIDERSSAEVAEKLGLSMAALRVLHHRARANLRQEYEKLSR